MNEKGQGTVGAGEDVMSLTPSPKATQEKQPIETPVEDASQQLLLHGVQLWLLLAALYMSVYLLALELTMLSTIIPTLTNEFHTVADISWYEAAYVLPMYVLTQSIVSGMSLYHQILTILGVS